MKTLETVTTFYYRGETFKVVQDEEGYFLAINKDDIDSNGVLTKNYNGITGHASKDMYETIRLTKQRVDIDIMVEEGYDNMVATIMVASGVDCETATTIAQQLK